MATDVLTVEPALPVYALYESLPEGSEQRRQRLYPVLGPSGELDGVLAWSNVLAARQAHSELPVSALIRKPVTARADETLRSVADRMVSSGHGVLPVIDHSQPHRLVGLISQFDLLRAHERVLVEERHRERPLAPYRLAGGLGALLPTREPA
jgi:CIC family chloride channel protein